MIEASLIISTYNWPEALELCLKSIISQVKMPAEVIVADDGSDSTTKEIIERYKDLLSIPLIHIWQPDKGFRKTSILNKAIKAANSGYIIQIDGDVILDTYFIYDHLLAAEHGTFIRGTRAMLTKEKTSELIQEKRVKLSAFSSGVLHRNNAFRSAVFKWFGTRKKKNSRNVRGSNLAFFKSDFVLVNGYNNDLTGWGHEDEELAARFINNGLIKKIVKLAAVQYHLFHPVSVKDSEPEHAKEVHKVVGQKIKFCKYGYDSLNYG